jgi:hypothetical protein
MIYRYRLLVTKPRWGDVQVRSNETVLAGRERLVALFRWLRGETSPGVEFVIAQRETVDRTSVDWSNFPLSDAVDAESEGNLLDRSQR